MEFWESVGGCDVRVVECYNVSIVCYLYWWVDGVDEGKGVCDDVWFV